MLAIDVGECANKNYINTVGPKIMVFIDVCDNGSKHFDRLIYAKTENENIAFICMCGYIYSHDDSFLPLVCSATGVESMKRSVKRRGM